MLNLNLHLRRPSEARVQALLVTQADASYTYEAVGATDAAMPPEFPQRTRQVDVSDFAAAREALRQWHQYDLGWCEIAAPRPPIEEGRLVATLARVWGLWTVNCCRIVRVVDEPDRFGYTIGTLPLHSEVGEERFLLERDAHGRATFEIRSFSGPSWWLVRVAWPVADRLIHRFQRQATARVQAATAGPR